MTVTIHVGKNAFFLESVVPVEEGDESPENSEPQTQDWDDLAGPGGAVGAPPQRVRRRRRMPAGIGRQHRCVIRKRDTLLEAVRAAVERLPEATPMPGPGLPIYNGGSGPLDRCPEKLTVSRLDEGYVVTHRKPIAKKDIEETLATKTDAAVKAKRADMMSTLMQGVFETMGRSTPGPTEVLGFDTVDEVVEFVGEATQASK